MCVYVVKVVKMSELGFLLQILSLTATIAIFDLWLYGFHEEAEKYGWIVAAFLAGQIVGTLSI